MGLLLCADVRLFLLAALRALADAAQKIPGVDAAGVAIGPVELQGVATDGMRGRRKGWRREDRQQRSLFGLPGFAAALIALLFADGAGTGIAQPGKAPGAVMAVFPVDLQTFAFGDQNPNFGRGQGFTGVFEGSGFLCPLFIADESNAFVAHEPIVEILWAKGSSHAWESPGSQKADLRYHPSRRYAGNHPQFDLGREGRSQRAEAALSAQSGAGVVAGGAVRLLLEVDACSRRLDLSTGVVASVSFSTGQSSASMGVQNPLQQPLIVLLMGPTGSGKTSLSLALGERLQGEIISCDSVAVYRGMVIGSARPSVAEQARLPHFLIDVANPDQPFTAGEYCRQGRAALAEISGRGHLPIVVGGTGLYLRALTEGLFDGPQRQEGLRERLRSTQERHGAGWLHRVLTRIDVASAERIHANDTPKLIRAIEICLSRRGPLSELLEDQKKARDPLTGYRLLRIGLNPPRTELYERLNRRCAEMFAEGLLDETRNLLAQYGPLKALDALGYRQARMALAGECSEQEAIAAAQQGHRNYAKRQLTWFRREPEVHWFESFGNSAETLEQVIRLVEEHSSTVSSV